MKKTKPPKNKPEALPTKKPFHVRHPLVFPSIFIVLAVIISLFAIVSFGGETIGAADKHIVNVHVDGSSRTVPTRAKTVGELLQRLNIEIGKKDSVEPAIETPIIEDSTEVNIYRARPVQIIDDGQKSSVILTATTSPRQAAESAGLKLHPEDGAEFIPPNDPLRDGVVAERLLVERSLPVSINVYGNIASYRTRAKTLDAFLKEKNIELKAGETIQPSSLDTPLTPGLLISVNLPGKQVATIEEIVPFKIEFNNDSSIDAGLVKVTQAGVAGKKLVLYEVDTQNGVEVGRRQLQTVTVSEPVSEVRSRGTKSIASFAVTGDRASIMAAAGISPSDYGAADFVIAHESGWRPGAISANGCIGLGQRCPSGGRNALSAACPNWQTDTSCQLQHFSAYSSRYGGWQGAYNFWLDHHWW